MTPMMRRGAFWSYASIGTKDECWRWNGAANRNGYGSFRVAPGVRPCAHRFAYEDQRGPIPAGMDLDHRCNNPRCVNPWHVEPTTHRENVLRSTAPAADRARQTHCKRGHELTRLSPEQRYCRTCHRERQAAYRSRGVTPC